MKNNSKTIQKIIDKLPIIIFSIYLIIIHTGMIYQKGDDVWFSHFRNQSLIGIMKSRYMHWTSRSILDIMTYIFNSYCPKLWVVINFACCYIIYYSLNIILNKNNNKYISYLIVGLFIIYPFGDMGSAGWIATTLNYLWPLSFGLLSFAILIDYFRKNKMTTFKYLTLIFSAIIACNHEQMCLLMFGLLSVFTVYYIYKSKKINHVLITTLLISLIELINHILCPGNAARMVMSIKSSFPGFKSLSPLVKLSLALNNTYEMIIGNLNYIFVFMLITIFIINLKNKSNYKIKFFSILLIILAIITPFTGIFNTSSLYGGYMCKYGSNCQSVLQLIQYGSKKYILTIFLAIFFTISIIYLLYKCFQHQGKMKIVVPLLFVAAILSRMVVGFSPTLYISGYRTGIFMYFIFIIISIENLKKLKLTNLEQNYTYILLVVFALLSHIVSLSLNIRI
jgi:hypothetical protein